MRTLLLLLLTGLAPFVSSMVSLHIADNIDNIAVVERSEEVPEASVVVGTGGTPIAFDLVASVMSTGESNISGPAPMPVAFVLWREPEPVAYAWRDLGVDVDMQEPNVDQRLFKAAALFKRPGLTRRI